ncbi:ABC transporter ATP-binding protein [Weissella bombi]|uniref:Putative ABC transport system ATP-binding protein n=1 Tax=Weissella bombi TaxID=1505725 RepID=A0A1C3ZQI6_9LACO|nr:ABC transporter ATP-binding protein [Weissella bombi]SCB84526.1 putative ABC transport system ATP-binding protein [Weissella bombi]
MNNLISFKNVTKSYIDGENKKTILNNVSLQIKQADFVVIVGESGSGKTTLLNIISLLDNNFDGEYLLNNENIQNMSDYKLSKLRRDRIGFVFQDFKLLPNLNVEQNVQLQREYQTNPQKKEDVRTYVNKLLKIVGLLEHKHKFPNQLSGGQKQRVAIARSLFNDADIVIADEPTGALDKDTGKSIMELLRKLNGLGKTIILVTHDLSLADYAKQKIVVDTKGVHKI